MNLNFILGTVICLFSLSTVMATDVQRVIRGNERFGKDLYNILSKQDGNLIASPFSAHVVLSMAYAGADGSTAEAMQKVLGVDDAVTTANQYNSLFRNLKEVTNVTLNLANKIFLKEGFGIKPEFSGLVMKQYGSAAEELDFTDSVNSANTINTWVEDQTNHKIKELIKPDMLDDLTRLVLVNAVYFKGNWAKQFKKENTREEPFYLLDGRQTKCQMMHINGKFNYMEDKDLNAKVLEMPYAGEKMSMLIFLPNERDGLPHLEKEIANFDFANYDKNMNKWECDVSLPKFKIESKIPLTKILKEMGMEVMFSNKADFSKIAANGESLKVSEVIQKAFIEVNEEGAEAAAATGVLFAVASAFIPSRTYTFIVDRPFSFALIYKENQNNNVLFTGRVQNLE